MASKTTYFCDRCKREFKRSGYLKTVKAPKEIKTLLFNDFRCFSTIEYDFCDDCFDDFMKFLGGRKIEDGK